jgi:hydrogenase expression/formation protein HypE
VQRGAPLREEREMIGGRESDRRVRLAHGGGGRLMRELVRDVFGRAFGDGGEPRVLEDAALLETGGAGRLAFTTDTFVVTPLFFPGGNVGDLAVNGTVNDLAMRGARPLALSVAVVIEEGFAWDDLEAIAGSMARAARSAGVAVVTGDTKVVPRGAADGIFVNTAGVGIVPEGRDVSAGNLGPGDRVLVSGPVGDHGVAVMSRRAGLSFEADVESDTAALNGLVESMFAASAGIRAMRDPTRGGLAAALSEMAEDSRVAVLLDERVLPVRPVVRAACETLGLDPLHVPCEGRLVAIVAAAEADAVLEAMRGHELGRGAVAIGEVREGPAGRVELRTRVGGLRLVDLPAGELLPRIC